MKILVVEDEKSLNNIIVKHLKKEGYGVDTAFDGIEAIEYLNVSNYDVILADVMMPHLDGFTLIQRIRDMGLHTPVLFITAKDTTDDRVKGLDLGADDYLVKPFEFAELFARIRVLVRRNYGNNNNFIEINGVRLDSHKKSVSYEGKNLELTSKEYSVLEYLIFNKGRVISRNMLQEHIWDFDYQGASNIIEVLIKNIRKKLSEAGAPQIIFTKRGLGYVVKEKDNG